MKSAVRVRFAPAPRGVLSLPAVHTALFNWLFARHEGGSFVLRLEDAELPGLSPEAEQGVFVSLKWLGLNWDEGPVSYERFSRSGSGAFGPYRQSERLDRYREYLARLAAQGRAYPCFCLPEELEEDRRQRARRGCGREYSGKCASLSETESKKRRESGRVPVWRFRPGEGEVCWTDFIRGEMRVRPEQIGDFVLVRATGRPVSAFAAVIDDHLMEISHVIGGEEQLPQIPRQLLLYQALNWTPPVYATLPLLTGPDHKPLSPRHSLYSLDDLYQLGCLAEAVFHYLALLGGAAGEECFERSSFIHQFNLESINRSPAVFDAAKLKWLNRQYLRRHSVRGLAELLRPHLAVAGYDPACYEEEWLAQAAGTIVERISVLSEAPAELEVYLKEETEISPEAQKYLTPSSTRELARRLLSRIEAQPELTPRLAHEIIRQAGRELNLQGRALFMPVRVLLSGRTRGPDLAAMMAVLGKERVLRRLRRFLAGSSIAENSG